MANTYELSDGKHAITIISNKTGQKHGNNRLIIQFLSIELSKGEFKYWTGKFIKTGMFTVKLEPGKPYEHIFQGIKINSKDQKTFSIEM